MSPWSQDALKSPRRGGREREEASERWKGESGAVPAPKRLGNAKSSDVASSIPEYSSKLSRLSLTHTKWKRIKLLNHLNCPPLLRCAPTSLDKEIVQ